MKTADIVAGLKMAALQRPVPLQAQTFLHRKYNTYTTPIWVIADDDKTYVVKGMRRNKHRALFNDQVVARLGCMMGAPVGPPALVDITQDFKLTDHQLYDIDVGIAHGTREIENTTNRLEIAHTDKHYNRERFAALAVLYGWLYAGDHQLIYCKQPRNLVYSVDHGHFFPSGPDWTKASLAAASGANGPSDFFDECHLPSSDITAAANALIAVTDDNIVNAVGLPPDEWKVSQDERIALVHFIITRRDEMVMAILH